ncbi:MAG TPA: nicotinamide riboside transporter PnuC, partial [Rhodothermales bacterium]|nr:nicotinamide riboside transporter PnuC [Rhodothermales bacterium]
TLASVYAARRNSAHVWWTGMVAVSLYGVLFYGTKLYADVVLQAFFFATSVAGWWAWQRGGAGHTRLPIATLPPLKRVAVGAGVVLAAGGAGWAFATFTDAALPFADSFILGASVVAQLLMMRRVIEHWPVWIAVDVVAVAVYGLKGLYLTAGVYAVLLALCVVGLRAWRREYAAQTPVAA